MIDGAWGNRKEERKRSTVRSGKGVMKKDEKGNKREVEGKRGR